MRSASSRRRVGRRSTRSSASSLSERATVEELRAIAGPLRFAARQAARVRGLEKAVGGALERARAGVEPGSALAGELERIAELVRGFDAAGDDEKQKRA